jgi:hypothetical protein
VDTDEFKVGRVAPSHVRRVSTKSIVARVFEFAAMSMLYSSVDARRRDGRTNTPAPPSLVVYSTTNPTHKHQSRALRTLLAQRDTDDDPVFKQ